MKKEYREDISILNCFELEMTQIASSQILLWEQVTWQSTVGVWEVKLTMHSEEAGTRVMLGASDLFQHHSLL